MISVESPSKGKLEFVGRRTWEVAMFAYYKVDWTAEATLLTADEDGYFSGTVSVESLTDAVSTILEMPRGVAFNVYVSVESGTVGDRTMLNFDDVVVLSYRRDFPPSAMLHAGQLADDPVESRSAIPYEMR